MLLRSGCGFWRLFQPRSCDAIRPSATFYPRFVCFSPAAGVAYLFAGPLLVVEQLKRQLRLFMKRSAPAACRWMRAGITFTCYARANYSANTQCAKRSAIRGAALDMRAFRIHNRRTTYGHQPIAPYNA